MKRLLVTLIAMLYLATTVGAAVRVHYCMGKVVGIGLVAGGNSEGCGTCSKKKTKKNCCRTEYKVVKNTSQHLLSKLVLPVSNAIVATTARPVYSYYGSHYASVAMRSWPHIHGPPPGTCPVYIRNCVFRI